MHKNTEICVKLCKNTEIIAICYWSEFPEVGSPVNVSHFILPLSLPNLLKPGIKSRMKM